ncbi:MAG: AzlC family ABC transporter permease [Oscillospiraceae bacterium]|nr:AzlC family ABC transporter permease [Oscillospiraceae bacterium]
MREQNSFAKGVRDGLPICFGYLSVAFAFGIFALSHGLTVVESVLMSMTNVTSAGQLAAVPIIATGGTLIELAVSQLVINLRYALMSVSLSQKLGPSVRLIDRFLISFVNTDEVFAVASSQNGAVGRKYMYGLILMPFLGWSAGTLIGAAAGEFLPEIVISALGIAIYGMFIAIVLPKAKGHRPTAACVGIAIVLSCVFTYVPVLKEIPRGFTVILCAVVAAAVMAILAPVGEEEDHA